MSTHSKAVTATALIAGTSIGGGVLMLPVLVSRAGFLWGMCVNAVAWIVMLGAAIVMARQYLRQPIASTSLLGIYSRNRVVRTAVEATYDLLYLALLVAYSTGMANVVRHLCPDSHWQKWVLGLVGLSLCWVLLKGRRVMQAYNALFVVLLLVLCGRLIVPCLTRIDVKNLTYSDVQWVTGLFPLFMCSYGFHVVLPTICQSLRECPRAAYTSIACGSAITFCVYTLFILGGLGCLPQKILQVALRANLPVTIPIGEYFGHNMTFYGGLISLLAMMTSFLGVGEGFAQFLSENGRVSSLSCGRCVVLLVPLIGLLKISSLLLKSLNGAGVICVLLFCVLPLLSEFEKSRRPQVVGVADDGSA